jgi:hypothetical protein
MPPSFVIARHDSAEAISVGAMGIATRAEIEMV